MIHNRVYEKFKELMPFYGYRTKKWFTNGKDSIIVVLDTGQQYVFTVFSDNNWQFETIDRFFKRTRESKKGVQRM